MTAEHGALARFFPGWTRADLRDMPVRERRHWVRWAQWQAAREARARDGG